MTCLLVFVELADAFEHRSLYRQRELHVRLRNVILEILRLLIATAAER